MNKKAFGIPAVLVVVMFVAAEANEETATSSAPICHAWVLPVVASDNTGRPLHSSELSGSVWKRGVSALEANR